MGTWGATAPLDPHAVGGFANRSSSSQTGQAEREKKAERGKSVKRKKSSCIPSHSRD